MTTRGHNARANRKFRSRRSKAHGDARSVPGGHKVTGLCTHGTTERARANPGERKLLEAWDNQGGTGNTVEWVRAKVGEKYGHTRLRKMAPSGELLLADVFPHAAKTRNIVITKANGTHVAVQVRLYTNETVNGDCHNVGAPTAGESRPERWSEHGKHVNGGWRAGARFNTEKQAFSWDVDRGKD